MPTFSIPLRITWREEASAQAWREQITILNANPQLIAQLLRQAMAETLLAEYRARFEKNFESMADTELYPRTHTEIVDNSLFDRINKLEQNKVRLSRQDTPNQGVLREIQDEIDALQRRYHSQESGEGGSSSRETLFDNTTASSDAGSGTGGGVFKPMMRRIRDMLTLQSNIASAPTAPGGPIIMGIGDLKSLEGPELRTPSATPGGSPSKYNIMWRQLEFGTGIYAKGGPFFRTSGPNKDLQGEGGWWYGGLVGADGRRRRLHIKGARGGHFLRDTTGLPYRGDAAKFQTYFALLLSRELVPARR